MKTKIVVRALLALIVFGLSANAIADRYNDLIGKGDKIVFCNYQGALGNVDDTEKEFKMLLDPPESATFRMVSQVIYQIYHQVRFGNEDGGYDPIYLEVLRNTDCNVSKYTSRFIAYYEAHKETLKEKKIHLPSNTYESFEPMIKYLKDEFGTEFLRNASREIRSAQMRSACLPPDGHPTSYDCAHKTVLTMMELINAEQPQASS